APVAWRPDLRERFIDESRLPKDIKRIDAPTSHVCVIGRTKTDGPQDYDAVHEIQAGLKVTPLSEWGRTPRTAEVKTDPSVDMKTPPKVQVDARSLAVFDELRQSVKEIEFLADPNGGELRIGCSEVMASGFASAVVAELTLRFPRLLIRTELAPV